MESIPQLIIFDTQDLFDDFCDRVLDLTYLPTDDELTNDYQFNEELFFLVRRNGVNYLVYSD